jgi:hypothetical protein
VRVTFIGALTAEDEARLMLEQLVRLDFLEYAPRSLASPRRAK